MKLRNLPALLLASLLLLTLCACASPGTVPEAGAGDASAGSGEPLIPDDLLQDPGALPGTVPSTGNPYCDILGVSRDAVLLTVNGENVTAEEYFFWLVQSYDYLTTNYGPITDWTALVGDMTVSDYLLADTLETVKFYHLFTTDAIAQYPQLALTAEEQAYIDSYVAEYAAAYFGDEAAFEAALEASLYISPETFLFANCTVPALYNKLFELMFDSSDYLSACGADEAQAYLDEYILPQGYIRAAHILVRTVDDDREPLPEEQIAEAEVWAEELLAMAQEEGAAFFALMEQYSQDTGKEDYPSGYYFNADSGFVPEFYDAAMALAEGEMSGLVESSLGFHIILRLPPDPADFAEEVCWLQYEDLVSAWAARSQVVLSEDYARIDPALLFAAPAA